MSGPQQMAPDPEEILHNAVDRGEPLDWWLACKYSAHGTTPDRRNIPKLHRIVTG